MKYMNALGQKMKFNKIEQQEKKQNQDAVELYSNFDKVCIEFFLMI